MWQNQTLTSSQFAIDTTFPVGVSPRKAVLDMMLSYVKPQLLYVAVKLGIADLLQDQPLPFAQIASVIQAEPSALYRLLLGLVNIGMLCTENGEFGLTLQGSYLVSGRPGSLCEIVILQGEEVFQAWSQLLYSVQTGKPAFEHVFGSGFFDYLTKNPNSQARFDAFMSNTSHLASKAVAHAYDFSATNTVVDVGGSNGVLLATILEANPHLYGILFDITAQTTQSAAFLHQHGVAARCQVLQGDFFESVPTGGDVYILSQIIHDWDDAHSLQILRNCYQAMHSQSRLLLSELIMPPQMTATPSPAVDRDLVMLVLTGGRERTEAEFETMLNQAGFDLLRLIPTDHRRVLLEAKKR